MTAANRKIAVRKSPKWWRKQRYYFVVLSPQGKVTAQSEMYVRHIDAVDEANNTAKAKFTVKDETGIVA